MGKLLANLKKNKKKPGQLNIADRYLKGIKTHFHDTYLVMTRACVLLSILLANKRAWPQRPAFMAASRASYS